MARDPGLEELLREKLGPLPGLSERPMFGGLALLLDGHLLCAARDDGLLIRLGKDRDGWALGLTGIAPMVQARRPMTGWVWAREEAYGDDALRARLIAAALEFVATLPPR